MKLRPLVLLFLVFIGLSVMASAQEREYKVLLRNGNTFYGVLMEKTVEGYVFKIKGGQIDFLQAEIKDMIPTGKKFRLPSKEITVRKTLKINPKAITNFDDLIVYFSKKNSLDPALIKAVIKAESDFDVYCVSDKGAKGLMQLMPGTARCLGVFDIYSPHQNIEGGTKYLAEQLRVFGDVRLALAAYNAGPENVKKYNGIPPFTETRNYISNVLTYWQFYNNHPISIKKAVFMYTDEQGNVFLSDVAANAKYKRIQ